MLAIMAKATNGCDGCVSSFKRKNIFLLSTLPTAKTHSIFRTFWVLWSNVTSSMLQMHLHHADSKQMLPILNHSWRMQRHFYLTSSSRKYASRGITGSHFSVRNWLRLFIVFSSDSLTTFLEWTCNVSPLTPGVHQNIIHTLKNLQLSGFSFFRYVSPFGGHQALKC